VTDPAHDRRPTRRRGPRTAGWLAAAVSGLAAALLVLGAVSPVSATDPALRTGAGLDGRAGVQTRPNIVVVMTDDMRADEVRFLPAVRRLQRSGVTFTQALSPDSLCCPARATLLTGKLAHNHLTIGNGTSTHGGYQVFADHNDLERLLPQWLDNKDYRTAWIGKYLNGVPALGLPTFRQPDWTYFAVPVERIYDYRANGFAINGRVDTVDRYRELYTRELLLSRVRAWSPSARPFFVLYSALAPHRTGLGEEGSGPPEVQAIHRGFDTTRLTVAPSVGEADMSDKPAWLRAYVAETGLKTYPLRLETHRVEALQSVNDTVRRLMEVLKNLHETRRTIVVFTSDNGYLLQEHNQYGKNKGYNESVQVPLVVRGPGFSGGTEVGATVSLADVTATIRRAAGITRPHGADGIALQDVLEHPSYARRPVEIEGSVEAFPHSGDLETDAIGRFYTGAVWGPYSLVHYQNGDREFYDRTVDPWQMDSAYAQRPVPGSPQDLLEQWYEAHVDCRGAACNDRLPAP
jgi:arylsulfatase A-like enzyme